MRAMGFSRMPWIPFPAGHHDFPRLVAPSRRHERSLVLLFAQTDSFAQIKSERSFF